MSKDFQNIPFEQMRRTDRAMTDETWIADFLKRAPFGALATVVDGQPFINSNIFVYDESKHVIYMHTAKVGRTRSNVEVSPQVCFSVSEMGRLLPADVALEFSLEYCGVAIFGTVAIIRDKREAKYALQLLLDKYFPHFRPGLNYRAITHEELRRTSVYRIEIERWSGKQKKVEEDFEGAFYYEEIL